MAKEKQALPSAFLLFSKSWEAVQRNLSVFGVLYIIPFISVIANTFNRPEVKESKTSAFSNGLFGGWSPLAIGAVIGTGILIALIGLAIGLIVQAMLAVAELESAQGQTLTLGKVWERARPLVLRLFGLSVVTGLIVFAGLILLIVPGMIFIRRYLLAPYYMIDRDVSISEALKLSAADSKKFAGAIWGLIGVTLLIALTGIVPVVGGLISFVLGLMYSVAPALRYQEIKQAS